MGLIQRDQQILFIISKIPFFISFGCVLACVRVSKTNWKMQTFYDYINIMIYNNTNDILLRIKMKSKKLMHGIVNILNIFRQTEDFFHFKLWAKKNEFIYVKWYFQVQITKKKLSTYFHESAWAVFTTAKMKTLEKCSKEWFNSHSTKTRGFEFKNKRNVKYHRNYFIVTLRACFSKENEKRNRDVHFWSNVRHSTNTCWIYVIRNYHWPVSKHLSGNILRQLNATDEDYFDRVYLSSTLLGWMKLMHPNRLHAFIELRLRDLVSSIIVWMNCIKIVRNCFPFASHLNPFICKWITKNWCS